MDLPLHGAAMNDFVDALIIWQMQKSEIHQQKSQMNHTTYEKYYNGVVDCDENKNRVCYIA